MSLDMLQAVVQGYGDAILDQQIVAVQSGYWSAYYSNAKHPKSVNKIAEDMLRRHNQAKQSSISTPRPDVDVEAFLELEAQFKTRLEQQGR